MEPWSLQVEHSQLRSRAEFEDALFSQCRNDGVGQVEGLLYLLGTHQTHIDFAEITIPQQTRALKPEGGLIRLIPWNHCP
jgi:hypothetical protein